MPVKFIEHLGFNISHSRIWISKKQDITDRVINVRVTVQMSLFSAIGWPVSCRLIKCWWSWAQIQVVARCRQLYACCFSPLLSSQFCGCPLEIWNTRWIKFTWANWSVDNFSFYSSRVYFKCPCSEPVSKAVTVLLQISLESERAIFLHFRTFRCN